MARKPEQKVWDALREAAVPHGAWLWLERIENLAGDGMPDVVAHASPIRPAGSILCGFVGHASVETWIELKAAKLPARASTRLLGDKGLRVDQVSWHRKAASHGVRSLVVIRDDAAAWYAIPGAHAAEMNALPAAALRALSLADNLPQLLAVLRGQQ